MDRAFHLGKFPPGASVDRAFLGRAGNAEVLFVHVLVGELQGAERPTVRREEISRVLDSVRAGRPTSRDGGFRPPIFPLFAGGTELGHNLF